MKNKINRQKLDDYTNTTLLRYARNRAEAILNYKNGDYEAYKNKENTSDILIYGMLVAIGMFENDGDATLASHYAITTMYDNYGIIYGREVDMPL